MTSELAVKLDRVRGLLERRGLPALTLTGRESLAWLTCGARVTVPTNGDPVLSALVTPDALTFFAYANEVDRLRGEELVGLGDLELIGVPWHEPLPGLAGAAFSTGDTAADLQRAAGEASAAAELRALRAPLLPAEVERYRTLGAEVAGAVTAAARQLSPDSTEREAAASLAHAVVALGAEPIVLLVAGESRLALRHPLPTAAPLGRRAMLVVGARRGGLIVNLTRWVGAPNEGSADGRLLEVEADAFAATRPGRTLAQVLRDIRAAYPSHGFAADEWQRHHQGGAAGYAGRDPRATPAATDLVVDGQAFAWNPSVPGGKVEDTVIITGGSVDVLTADPAWPTVAVRGLARPAALPFG
ncbi:MAG: M24 family metallopeptidase [Microbacteriaceae bacterium]|nr:M24 family metallopeptidase [Microbacteriaceae bacterium]MCL2794142.1 M24 family metallopeptidase [Microbacteriaceae bacterium]